MVIAWLVTQVLEVLLDSFGAPGWVMKTVLVLLAAGFVFAIFFSWAFEMTPEGLKRETEVDRTKSISAETGRKLDYTIIAVLVLALGYFAWDKFVLGVSRDAALVEAAKQEAAGQVIAEPVASAVTDKSIAVLPFVNMSGDPENEYFSDGLTEELLNALARIEELKVTGRTSSFAFKGKEDDLRVIGKALGVAHILEGSVRKANNRVRITAQLIKVDDGYHLWSDTFDRELDDIFAIQEEIATMVVKELASTLLGDSTGPLVHLGTTNAEAYEAYLRGRYIFNRRPDDVQVQNQAEELFQQALDLDPNFTLAWFGHFSVLDFRQRGGGIDYQQGAVQLRELADKIVAMDPELAEGYIASGRAALVEMRWSEAEAAYRKALSLSPGNIDATTHLSGLMSLVTRKDEALELALKALALDPLNLPTLGNLAIKYNLLGRCDEGKKIVERALILAPDASRFHGRVGNCLLLHQGDYAAAIEWFEKEPVSFKKFTGLAIAYNKLGQHDKAQYYLDELIASNGEAASYQYGQIYAQWGETEKALDALEYAWDIHDTGVVLLNMDSFVDPLRDEPRFIALMEKWKDPAKR